MTPIRSMPVLGGVSAGLDDGTSGSSNGGVYKSTDAGKDLGRKLTKGRTDQINLGKIDCCGFSPQRIQRWFMRISKLRDKHRRICYRSADRGATLGHGLR